MENIIRYKINDGVRAYQEESGAVLVDVRDRDEYAGGHIPGSINVPLMVIGDIADDIPDMETPVYVYCLSGRRSGQAAAVLEQMGYEKIRDIGGIERYEGKVEK